MGDHTMDWNVLQETLDDLTPTEKLQLIEEAARSLRAPTTAQEPEKRNASLERLRRELAALPVRNPADGFSGRDHDSVLYGGSS